MLLFVVVGYCVLFVMVVVGDSLCVRPVWLLVVARCYMLMIVVVCYCVLLFDVVCI